MANQRIKANLIPSCDIYPVIHLAQYDVSDGTGKQVEIELYYGTDKFTIPSGSSITFRGTKRDKTGYSYEITKFSDNVVTVDVKPQMTVLSGTHFAELRISKGNTISNTIKFVMKIDSSALADDTKVSETDLSVIEKALQASDAAIQAKAEVEQLKASVEKSEKNAKQSETNASQSATNAQESAENASTSATTASTKATEASTSATKAKESETNAKLSETNASNSAKQAQTSADSIANVVTDVNQIKEDVMNIKKKKNVVIYVGSSELSEGQKLSCDYVCDGVDDQNEINQAISSLPDSGGEVHLSRGIFNISNSIVINKRIKLVGEGKGITLDRNNVNNGGTTLLTELTVGTVIVITKSDTLSDIKGITLSDFQIVGAGINVENNYCNGINVDTYTDCVTLERLAFCHLFYGLLVNSEGTADDMSISNCDFQRDSCGIYVFGKGWQTRIENNIFWDMKGTNNTVGILLSQGANIVNGNYFGVSSLISQDVASAWITAHDAVSLLCVGNYFSKCAAYPIRFNGGGQFANINGNTFDNVGRANFQPNEQTVLYVDGNGTGGGRISFTNNTVFWADNENWKTVHLAYLINQAAQVNVSNNTIIDGIGKVSEDNLVFKSEDSTYAITIGNNVLC